MAASSADFFISSCLEIYESGACPFYLGDDLGELSFGLVGWPYSLGAARCSLQFLRRVLELC